MKIAVVITNDSTSDPDEYAGRNNPRPYGGNIMSYTSDYIINFRPIRGMPGRLYTTLVKSPFGSGGLLPLRIEEHDLKMQQKILSFKRYKIKRSQYFMRTNGLV